MESLVGTTLEGAYQLVGILGQGGMGAVYEAVQTRLNKRVAVKVMARELAANAEATARFRREAEVTSSLGHPHIVQVFDFGTMPSGELYLVMELMKGEDLDHRLRRDGRLSPQGVLRIVQQVAGALDATHEKGIIHRDLKPANIYLLEASGEPDFVKVLDFGISKVCTATTKLTKTSMVMGTPNYMSPEQALGQVDQIDERTDQWALACIAWEALSGQGPFQADNTTAVLFQVVHEPPAPLAEDLRETYPELETILCRALAKDKNDRFASVGEFYEALKQALVGPRASSSVAPRGPSKRRATTGTGSAGRLGAGRMRRTELSTLSQSSGQVVVPRGGSSRQGWALGTVAGLAAVGLVGILVFARTRPANKVMPSAPVGVAGAIQAEPHVADAAPAPQPAPAQADEPATTAERPPAAAPASPSALDGKRMAAKKVKPVKAANAVELKEPTPACNPNFYLDAQGEKHFKRECFLNAQ